MKKVDSLLEPLPAQAQIQRQVGPDPPIVLKVESQVRFLKRQLGVSQSGQGDKWIVRHQIAE